MEQSLEEIAVVFRAFSDTNRLEILDILRSGEHCACELLEKLEIGQSTLSHHMKILTDSGIVLATKDGKWTHYTIEPVGCKHAIAIIKEFSVTKKRKPVCCKG